MKLSTGAKYTYMIGGAGCPRHGEPEAFTTLLLSIKITQNLSRHKLPTKATLEQEAINYSFEQKWLL